MRTQLLQLIERCRRQQQQIPGQLEMPDERESFLMLDPANVDRSIAERAEIPDDLTIADIDEQELYEEHCRMRMEFMLHAYRNEALWATEEEALQEWRDRTFHSLDLRHLFGGRLDRLTA